MVVFLSERRWLVALLLPAFWTAGAEASAPGGPTSWLTGPALQRQLASPVDVYWSATPLRAALVNLSNAQGVAVLLDRRIDPGQEIDLTAGAVPLGEVLTRIADDRDLAIAWLGPVAYLAPRPAAARVRTLAELRREERNRLPGARARALAAPRAVAWDDFATPRDLLSQAADEYGIAVSAIERVPHDLWAGADLPPICLVDRVTLIAGQFDLTFQWADDGSAITLVPISGDVAIERTYPAGPLAQRLADEWTTLIPDSRIRVDGDQIVVRGLLEDLERISRSVRPSRPSRAARPAPGPDEKRFTVRRAAGRLDQLLAELAAKLHLEVRYDRPALAQAGITLDQHVSFHVEEATLEELFEAVLEPADCTFERRGNAITVRPAP